MLGTVQVNNLNLIQGELDEVERYFLFVGRGAGTNEGKLVTVNSVTDLDLVLGEAASVLKAQVEAARLNAGENFYCCVFPLDGVLTWAEAVDYVMGQTSVEAVVVTDPVAASSDIEEMQAKAVSIMSQYMRPLFFIPTSRAIDPEVESWDTFVAEVNALVTGLACDMVSPVPTIWGVDQGAYAGRLCNSSVTVADSPMRVATGALVGEWSDKPVDKDGRALDMSILKALNDARWSVPQWYPDYPGVYWSDGEVLDVPGGDFQSVENLRVVQKAMRRVYPLAVARVADRRLNSTPASIAQNQTYFMRPLREMSRSVDILGITFPGEVEEPQEGDIVISWPTKYQVEIYMVARPYNCPKGITCNVLLDLTNYA